MGLLPQPAAKHVAGYKYNYILQRRAPTVPSRIKRMIGSWASARAFQASQSAFMFRDTRLTVSLLTAAASARRTRRLLVPAR